MEQYQGLLEDIVDKFPLIGISSAEAKEKLLSIIEMAPTELLCIMESAVETPIQEVSGTAQGTLKRAGRPSITITFKIN